MEKEQIATTEITNEKLLEIKEVLRKRLPRWPSLIAAKISKDPEWKALTKNACSEGNARNICDGKIQSSTHRRLFVKYAAELLLEESQKNVNVLTAAESIVQ